MILIFYIRFTNNVAIKSQDTDFQFLQYMGIHMYRKAFNMLHTHGQNYNLPLVILYLIFQCSEKDSTGQMNSNQSEIPLLSRWILMD